jgi:hypothetical protein
MPLTMVGTGASPSLHKVVEQIYCSTDHYLTRDDSLVGAVLADGGSRAKSYRDSPEIGAALWTLVLFVEDVQHTKRRAF